MKINEVEQLVGITKKNIRFYEEQGLLEPERNKANGYREYSESDVELLLKIKLLRRLSVPIEEIRKVEEGRLSLSECMERHNISLEHERHNIELMKQLCAELENDRGSFSELSARSYLDKMSELEKGGSRFMNVTATDVTKKKKRGAYIAAGVMVILLLLWDAFVVYLCATEPTPVPVVLVLLIPATAVIVGVLIALFQRIKELDKGEENEAGKY